MLKSETIRFFFEPDGWTKLKAKITITAENRKTAKEIRDGLEKAMQRSSLFEIRKNQRVRRTV